MNKHFAIFVFWMIKNITGFNAYEEYIHTPEVLYDNAAFRDRYFLGG